MISVAAVPTALLTASVARSADCGRYSSDGGSAECERRVDVALGLTVVVVVVLLVVGFVGWRVLLRRLGSGKNRDLDATGDVD